MNGEKLHCKILIAEDDLPTNILLQTYLKHTHNGEIITAFDGVEAVEKCMEHEPDIVCMDLRMPRKDGVTAIRELRASGFSNPVLVVSSYADIEKANCMEAGADDVIAKPLTREVFLDKIKEFRTIVKEESVV